MRQIVRYDPFVDWRTFQHTQLHRLLIRLREQQQLYADVESFAKQYGFPPDDPLRADNSRAYRALCDYIETVQGMAAQLAPYRPGVDPFRKQGMRAVLRPDFKARGITEQTDK